MIYSWNTTLIGITGRARAGKNTIAEAITTACIDRYDCKVYQTSSYVLLELQRLGKIPYSLTLETIKENPENLKLMVEHGMGARKRNPDIWIDYLFHDLAAGAPDIAVLPNIRFKNEAEFVKSYGGKIIRVKAVVADGVEYISTDRDPNNISETELHQIEADYFLTVKRGESDLLKSEASILFEYILRKK